MKVILAPLDYSKNMRDFFAVSPDKILVGSIVAFYFSSYILSSYFPINVFPILVGATFYFLTFWIRGNFIIAPSFLSWFFLCCFSLIGISYLAVENGLISFLSMEFFFLLYLPMMYASVMRSFDFDFFRFLSKGFFIFLIWQLLVVIGQISEKVFGAGFYLPAASSQAPSEHYLDMLSGTFYNSNDLAATCGMLFLFFVIYRKYDKGISGFAILICFVLALFSLSRAVLVFMVFSFFVFLFMRSFLRAVAGVAVLAGLFMVLFFFAQQYFNDYQFVARIIGRVESIGVVFSEGLYSDHSLNIRVFSYINFLYNLDDLGLGSMRFRDYSMFFEGLGSKYYLMSVNPHSFVVEIGYWLGWGGLVAFSFFLIFIRPMNYALYLYCLASFVLLTMVSSSVIGNFMLFLAFFAVLGLLQFSRYRSS